MLTFQTREILGDAEPGVGDAAEAFQVARWLQQVAQFAAAYIVRMRASSVNLASNRAVAIDRLDEQLTAVSLVAARDLADAVNEAQQVFQEYGAEIAQVRESAEVIRARASELVAVMQSCARRLEDIGQQLGVFAVYSWHSPPPIALPNAGLGQSSVAGSDPSQQVSLTAHLAGQWNAAAREFHCAVEEVDVLRTSWRTLYERRVTAEQRFAAALRTLPRTSRGQFAAGSAAGSGWGTAKGQGLAVVGLSAVSNATSQVQVGPATRRNHPLLIDLYRQSLVYFLRDTQPPTHLVEAWWSNLSATDRTTLMREVPLVIGNLNGVPLDARIAANAQSARHFAEVSGISDAERQYWQRVAAGQVTLVVSDPAQSRIIEMIGELGPTTAKVLTYVPGTGTQMKHFYQREAQQVAQYLVERSGGSTVAFVYKDGSWVSWVGQQSNTNYEFLHELGSGVRQFQSQVIDREPALYDVERVAAGHSAGVTVLSAAEIAGAEFDVVVSLGGSYLLHEWQPTEGTTYHHFQYENDVINRIDQGRLRTPHELDQTFEPHIFDSNGKAQLHSHSRVAQGPATNSAVLRTLARLLEARR